MQEILIAELEESKHYGGEGGGGSNTTRGGGGKHFGVKQVQRITYIYSFLHNSLWLEV